LQQLPHQTSPKNFEADFAAMPRICPAGGVKKGIMHA
jgi:hypothetical protein